MKNVSTGEEFAAIVYFGDKYIVDGLDDRADFDVIEYDLFKAFPPGTRWP